MGYISELDLFRDMNKNPDKYGIGLDKEDKQELEAEEQSRLEAIARGEIMEKIEKLGPTAANYRQVIDAVADFKLKSEYSENDPENKILSERKKVILGFLGQIIKDVERYIAIVNTFNIIYNSRNEAKNRESYLNDMHDADNDRRVVHNRLISDLKILIRAININLNIDFDSDSRFEAERKMPDRKDLSDTELKEALDKREYIKFDKKN
ncbi:MAG: hypothetical protein WCJ57_04930, partial [Candidatus Falkowbacteria bacterium]